MNFEKLPHAIINSLGTLKTSFTTVRIRGAQLASAPITKNFLIYSVGGIFLRGANHLLLPIILASIPPARFGLLSLINSFITVISLSLGMGLRQVFGVEFFKKNKHEQIALMYDISTIYLVVTTPILIGMLYLSNFIQQTIFFDQITIKTVALILAICASTFFSEIFYQLFRFQERAVALLVTQIIAAGVRIGLILVGLLYIYADIESMLIAQLISLICVTIIGYSLCRHDLSREYFNGKRALHYAWPYIKQGIPLVCTLIFTWILGMIDKWCISSTINLNNNGYYSLADTCGQLFYVGFIGPCKAAYFPYIYKKFAQNPFAQTYQFNLKLCWLIMTATIITIPSIFILGQPLLYWLIHKEYYPAISYILPVLFNYILSLGTFLAGAPITYTKDMNALMGMLFILVGIKTATTIYLMPLLGIYGCIAATSLTYGIYFWFILWYSNRLIQQRSIQPAVVDQTTPTTHHRDQIRK
ncbi:MAG: oligosaccharide flippase family protein [Candidatus Babeliales bacterium]